MIILYAPFIAPTAVTELRVEPEDSTTLRVSWGLPSPPNGPISHYIVYYNETTDPKTTSLVIDGHKYMMVPYPNVSYTDGLNVAL